MNIARWALRIGLPVVFVGVGALGMIKLIEARPKAKKVAAAERGALVDVIPAESGRRAVQVDAQGTVMAARSLELKVQVGGQVTELNEGLVPGGRVKDGDLLVRIERRDYDLAIHEASARVATAEQNRDMELGRRSVAEREWALLGNSAKAGEAAQRRALREPQKQNAAAAVRAAEATVAKARLAASRTRIHAPFNALVLDEAVEVGQVVQPGLRLARLVGTDAFWVQVSVPVSDLSWIDVPGASARVTHQSGDRVVSRRGTVVRLLGDLDPMGSMARLVVEVADPLGLEDGGEALLLRSFVQVAIDGRSVDDVYEVPRVALREGDRVWRVDVDDTLLSGPVKVVRRMRETVLVSGGLSDGDRVVTSRLASPVPGMKLRVKAPPATSRAEAAQ